MAVQEIDNRKRPCNARSGALGNPCLVAKAPAAVVAKEQGKNAGAATGTASCRNSQEHRPTRHLGTTDQVFGGHPWPAQRNKAIYKSRKWYE